MDKETVKEVVKNIKSSIDDVDAIRAEMNDIKGTKFMVIFMNLYTSLRSQIKINLELFEETVKNSGLIKKDKRSALKKISELRKEVRRRL